MIRMGLKDITGGDQYHHHRASLELGVLFHNGNIFQFSGDLLQQLPVHGSERA